MIIYYDRLQAIVVQSTNIKNYITISLKKIVYLLCRVYNIDIILITGSILNFDLGYFSENDYGNECRNK